MAQSVRRMRAALMWLAFAVVASALLVGVLYLVLVPLAHLIARRDIEYLTGKERIDALNSVRQLLLVAIGGVIASSGAVVATRTYLTNRRGQVTERYSRAISMLSSDKVDERLGGIYSLEQIMREAASEHDVILEVLTAFIREHSAERLRVVPPNVTLHPDDIEPPDEFDGPDRMIAGDIQAALDVVCRRPKRRESVRLDFSNANLEGANLHLGQLDNALFYNTVLWRASFGAASLNGATFNQCTGWKVNFSYAQLGNVRFLNSTFPRCNIYGAKLFNVGFNEVNLADSNLCAEEATGILFYKCVIGQAKHANPEKWFNVQLVESAASEYSMNFFRVSGARYLPGPKRVVLALP